MCVCKNKNSGKLFSKNGLWPSGAFPRSPKKNIQGTSANNLHDIWEVCVGDICDPQISYLLHGNMSADVCPGCHCNAFSVNPTNLVGENKTV